MGYKILVLGVGGFIGSNLRYWISLLATNYLGTSMPFGTLIVNGLGSFILGFLTIYSTEVATLNPNIRLMVGTGMMGALTTFSTFSLETVNLMKDTNYSLAIINILLNITVALFAVWIGFMAAKSMA